MFTHNIEKRKYAIFWKNNNCPEVMISFRFWNASQEMHGRFKSVINVPNRIHSAKSNFIFWSVYERRRPFSIIVASGIASC